MRTKFNKVIGLLLTIVLLAGIMPTAVFANQSDLPSENTDLKSRNAYVAKVIDNTNTLRGEYKTLHEAFAAVKSGDTVELLSNTTLSSQVNILNALDDLTFDGNGYTVTLATTTDPSMSGGSGFYFGNPGYCTGIKIRDLTIDGMARFAIFLHGGTSTDFNNVHISGDFYYAINLYGTHGGKFTDCTVENGYDLGDKNLNGAAVWSNVASDNPVTLINSHIDAIAINKYKPENAEKLFPKIFVDNKSSVNVHTLDDGEISGNSRLCVSADSEGDFTVNTKPTGSSKWVEAPWVAEIGSKKFGTLKDALSVAKSGDEITLNDNVNENITIDLTKGYTFDPNGFYANGATVITNSENYGVLTENENLIADIQKKLPEGYVLSYDDHKWDGTYTISPGSYVAQAHINENHKLLSFTNLGVAIFFAAAHDGGSSQIKLLDNWVVDSVDDVLTIGNPYDDTPQTIPTVILDLNGKTISGSWSLYGQTNEPIQIVNGALIIKDSSSDKEGTISSDADNGTIVVFPNGNLSVNDVTIEHTDEDGIAINSISETTAFSQTNPPISLSGRATAQINSGTINGELKSDDQQQDAKIIVSGGTFDRAVPTEFLASGFEPNENSDGSVSVTEIVKTPKTPSYSAGEISRTYYGIVSESTENGSVTLSSQSGSKGDTVTITVNPDAGYELSALIVTDSKGDIIPIVPTDDGKFKFKMPDGMVYVEPIFIEVKEATPNPIVEMNFYDVTKDMWSYEDIYYVYERGLMQGMGDNAFSPQETTNRAMVLTILYRIEGEPDVDGASSFKDVALDSWYTDAVIWAEQNGIVSGYGDGNVGIDDPITREQLAVILYRYMQLKGMDLVTLSENLIGFFDYEDISDYGIAAMNWAVNQGLISGADNNLMPTSPTTREQLASILRRFCENVLK